MSTEKGTDVKRYKLTFPTGARKRGGTENNGGLWPKSPRNPFNYPQGNLKFTTSKTPEY